MCGIAGFLGTWSPEALRAMSGVIAHRGPDDAGEWIDAKEGVALAHRRLSIIDLSERGHQPMWDLGGKVVISYNGEIYNYRELKRELEAGGFAFRSECDTEVILNLYLRDGVDCLQRLDGIFAFGLWDTRSQRLLIARDGQGVKPLYYGVAQGGFAFASELKALLRVPGLDRSLDHEAIAYYLTFLYAPSPHTMFKNMRKLRPGHALLVSKAGIEREWCYYELPFDRGIVPMRAPEAIAETRRLLRQAVERQMVADVPVGAFLSGGLDSSSIAAFAQDSMRDRQLACFTIGFRGFSSVSEGAVEDLPYAERVARHLGVDLRIIYVTPKMGLDLEEMIYQLDEPQADPAALNTLYICRLARESGIKVLLSGAGGDDIFTGYRRHRALILEKYWDWLPLAGRQFLRRFGRSLTVDNPVVRRFAKAFQYADLPQDPRMIGYFQWLSPEALDRLYGAVLHERLAGFNPAGLMAEALRRLPATTPPINRMLYLDTKYFLTDHNLNYTDKMSMAHGVEVRVPFLDNDLIAFAASLPIEYKQRGATGKWILKQAMAPFLPRDIVHRPKAGFGVPLRVWLRGEFGRLISDYLSRETVSRRGLFDPDGVTRLLNDDRAGRVDGAYTLLTLACIEIWLRRFVDRPAAA